MRSCLLAAGLCLTLQTTQAEEKNLSTEDIAIRRKAYFVALDKNTDDTISKEELGRSVVARVRGEFVRADGDENGSLSKEEFGEFVKRVRASYLAFEDLDKNADGQLSGKEIKGPARTTITDARFSQLDKNHDGSVSREEFFFKHTRKQ